MSEACDDQRTMVLSLNLRTCTDFHIEASSDFISYVIGWTHRSWAWSLFAKGLLGDHSCDGPQSLLPPAKMRAEKRNAPRPARPASAESQMWLDFWRTLQENDVISVQRCYSSMAATIDFSRHRFPEVVGPGPHFVMASSDLPKVAVTFFYRAEGSDVIFAVIGPLRGGGVASEDDLPFEARPRINDLQEVARILIMTLPPLSQDSRN